MVLRVYLSGSIKKGDDDRRSLDHFWSQANEEFIRRALSELRVEMLNPAKTAVRRSDYALNFGCDLHLVATSDVVLVDARTEKGIGVGAEMMFAAQCGIPVITWAPRNSHYRRDFVGNVFGEDLHDWTHPFIHGLSDYVVEGLGEAVKLLRTYVDGGRLEIRKSPDRLIAQYAEEHGGNLVARR